MQLSQPPAIFSTRSEYSSLNVEKSNKWWVLPKKTIFLKLFHGHVKCSFDSAAQNFFDKSLKLLSSLSKNSDKNRSYPKKKFWQVFSIRNIYCSFYNPADKIVDKLPEISHSASENSLEIRKFSSKKRSYGHVECNFDNPAHFLSKNGRKRSAQ